MIFWTCAQHHDAGPSVGDEIGVAPGTRPDAGGGGVESSRDTRRVAAIAFADVVGYSTLMAADEHGTYARWMVLLRGVIEPETARHGGRMLHVAGDGILLEFPTVD